jgi:hypothetical protein
MSTAQVSAMSTAQLAAMTTNQTLHGLTSAQIRVLTTAQFVAMTFDERRAEALRADQFAVRNIKLANKVGDLVQAMASFNAQAPSSAYLTQKIPAVTNDAGASGGLASKLGGMVDALRQFDAIGGTQLRTGLASAMEGSSRFASSPGAITSGYIGTSNK